MADPDLATVIELERRLLDPRARLVLLTYRTEAPSLRSSVWLRREDGAWRMLHHQGTSTGRG